MHAPHPKPPPQVRKAVRHGHALAVVAAVDIQELNPVARGPVRAMQVGAVHRNVHHGWPWGVKAGCRTSGLGRCPALLASPTPSPRSLPTHSPQPGADISDIAAQAAARGVPVIYALTRVGLGSVFGPNKRMSGEGQRRPGPRPTSQHASG